MKHSLNKKKKLKIINSLLKKREDLKSQNSNEFNKHCFLQCQSEYICIYTHTQIHTSYCAEVKKAAEAQYPTDKLYHLSDLQNDALESKFRNITLYIAAEQIYYFAYKFFELNCDFFF